MRSMCQKNSRLDSILIRTCKLCVLSIPCVNAFRLCPLCPGLPAPGPSSCPCLDSCCGVSFSLGQSRPERTQLQILVHCNHVNTDLEVRLSLPLPVISAAALIAVSPVEFSSQLATDGFEMHEVTEAGPGALPGLVLAAASLSEICHRCELGVDGPASKPAVVEVSTGFQSILKCRRYNAYYTFTREKQSINTHILFLEFHVYISHQMISQIITNIHLLDLN